MSREELFVTSKLWNHFHNPAHVEVALDRTLKDLQLDYLDLFLIHFPVAYKFVPHDEKYPGGHYCGDGDNIIYDDTPLLETWRALEKLVAKGKIRSIGISNFNGSLLMDLWRGAKIKPAVLQIEHHPYLQQQRLIAYAKRIGLTVTAYSSLGSTSYLVEESNHRAQNAPVLLEHDTIKAIAKAHGKTTAQVLLRWATQRGIAVIPKSNDQGRLEANLQANNFDLTDADFAAIAKLEANLRFNDPHSWDSLPVFD